MLGQIALPHAWFEAIGADDALWHAVAPHDPLWLLQGAWTLPMLLQGAFGVGETVAKWAWRLSSGKKHGAVGALKPLAH